MLNKRTIAGTLFVAPACLLHFFVIMIPALSMIYFAFTNWNGIRKPAFIGLANFKRMIFDDFIFHHALRNNLKWMLIMLTAPILCGLLISLIITSIKKMQMAYRLLVFIPYILASAVSARIWVLLSSDYFGVNAALRNAGIHIFDGILWLGDPKINLYYILFANIWAFWPFVMMLFIPALQQVEIALYEAATIEGANSFQKFLNVTLPGIGPTLITIIMYTVIRSFLSFDYVYLMTQGGPGFSSQLMSTWIYRNAFIDYYAGYANALALVVTAICCMIYFIFKSLQNRGHEV